MPYARELDAMLRWVEATDRIAMKHFDLAVPFETKSDGTPVTKADTEVEAALRASIEAEFPGDAIAGEEQGATGSGDRCWIIDPIDGTSNFARGVPVFATLIALERGGAAVAGVVSAPALDARWWAAHRMGAYRDGEAIHVSAVSSLSDAEVCWGELRWAVRLGWSARFGDRGARQRAFADFWGHVLVAQGSMDVMLEPAPLHPWDLAAPKVIVEESGGIVSDTKGNRGIREGAVVVSNGLLHQETLAVLQDRPG